MRKILQYKFKFAKIIMIILFVVTDAAANADNEKELIKKSLNGDSDAFIELIDPYKERVYSFLIGKTYSADEAEDILQNSLLKCYENLSKFEGKSRFYTWLFSIALNELKYHWRKKNKIRDNTAPAEIYDEPVIDNVPDCGTGVLEKIESIELNRHIYACVLDLPDIYKEIILLRYYEKASYEEISRLLKINIGTTKSRLSGAREKLKDLIKTEYL